MFMFFESPVLLYIYIYIKYIFNERETGETPHGAEENRGDVMGTMDGTWVVYLNRETPLKLRPEASAGSTGLLSTAPVSHEVVVEGGGRGSSGTLRSLPRESSSSLASQGIR